MNIWSFHLKFMGFDAQFEVLSKLLDAHIAAIQEGNTELEKERRTGGEDSLEALSDEQSDFVENIYGCSMVACQAYLTLIVSRVKSLHDALRRKSMTLSTTSGRKKDIMGKFSSNPTGSAYTQIEIINALANYYKHADEWNLDWAKEQGQSAETISIIQTLGLESGSSANLATGVKALCGGLKPLPPIIRDWQSKLTKAYELELQRIKLI